MLRLAGRLCYACGRRGSRSARGALAEPACWRGRAASLAAGGGAWRLAARADARAQSGGSMANVSIPPHFEPWGGYVNCSSRADCVELSGGLSLVACVAFSGGLPEGAPLNRGVCVCSIVWGRQGAGCNDVVEDSGLGTLLAVLPLVVNVVALVYIARSMYQVAQVPGLLQMNAAMAVIISCAIVCVLQMCWQVMVFVGLSTAIPGSSSALTLANSCFVTGSICATLVSVL